MNKIILSIYNEIPFYAEVFYWIPGNFGWKELKQKNRNLKDYGLRIINKLVIKIYLFWVIIDNHV